MEGLSRLVIQPARCERLAGGEEKEKTHKDEWFLIEKQTNKEETSQEVINRGLANEVPPNIRILHGSR